MNKQLFNDVADISPDRLLMQLVTGKLQQHDIMFMKHFVKLGIFDNNDLYAIINYFTHNIKKLEQNRTYYHLVDSVLFHLSINISKDNIYNYVMPDNDPDIISSNFNYLQFKKTHIDYQITQTDFQNLLTMFNYYPHETKCCILQNLCTSIHINLRKDQIINFVESLTELVLNPKLSFKSMCYHYVNLISKVIQLFEFELNILTYNKIKNFYTANEIWIDHEEIYYKNIYLQIPILQLVIISDRRDWVFLLDSLIFLKNLNFQSGFNVNKFINLLMTYIDQFMNAECIQQFWKGYEQLFCDLMLRCHQYECREQVYLKYLYIIEYLNLEPEYAPQIIKYFNSDYVYMELIKYNQLFDIELLELFLSRFLDVQPNDEKFITQLIQIAEINFNNNPECEIILDFVNVAQQFNEILVVYLFCERWSNESYQKSFENASNQINISFEKK
ncbi:Hypothetical_protein [Hexamita inflata]|uniref:Hypothetical_protein n=1 Tax=Hexamita inflata TaxID=28002 RepID=A0AA86PBT6_9EUKA|nr:Hypothetical protein HINF_LOCUS23412 [Hexamita inflata]